MEPASQTVPQQAPSSQKSLQQLVQSNSAAQGKAAKNAARAQQQTAHGAQPAADEARPSAPAAHRPTPATNGCRLKQAASQAPSAAQLPPVAAANVSSGDSPLMELRDELKIRIAGQLDDPAALRATCCTGRAVINGLVTEVKVW